MAIESIKIDNAFILPGGFRNFSGRPTRFNKAGGSRSFCVSLNEDQAEWFRAKGFTVQEYQNPNDPDSQPVYHLSIKLSYKLDSDGNQRGPKIVMITGNKGTELTEKTVANLDTAEIVNADVWINPYAYDVNGRTGYSAYLRELWITIAESPYAKKYKDLVMSSSDSDSE